MLSALPLLLAGASLLATATEPETWTIFVAGDTCPDVTWGFDEATTKSNLAELIAAHLDTMTATDGEAPENQSRYNACVLYELLCFVERYPERRAELARRLGERRLWVSPFLNNTLWGLQSTEAAIRGLYPARRLETEWGLDLTVAEHIELPSLPWGQATVLAGCGVRWLSVPFLAYDGDFERLTNPPVFDWLGPDGSRVRVVLDAFASQRANYVQGGWLLDHPEAVGEWLGHYESMGDGWPARLLLASGTHGDTMPHSGAQAPEFASRIKAYNAQPGPHPRLVNATLPAFCAALDQADRQQPFVPSLRGGLGHSWEAWPVSLANLAAAWRLGQHALLASESLLSAVSGGRGPAVAETAALRQQAEWDLTMLADHAWNGTDPANRSENARLRRGWSQGLTRAASELREKAAGGLPAAPGGRLALFNPLSWSRDGLLSMELPAAAQAASLVIDGQPAPSQVVVDEGERRLVAWAPPVPAFGWSQAELAPQAGPEPGRPRLSAAPTALQSPFYSLTIDPATGGLSRLEHRGRSLLAAGGPPLGEVVYELDGQVQTGPAATCEVLAEGPVLATVRVRRQLGPLSLSTDYTVYADQDRLDFETRLERPATQALESVRQRFALAGTERRLETTGAVVRPDQDVLPGGAAHARWAIQGYFDAAEPGGPGATLVPREAFLLLLGGQWPEFALLGNDHNHHEVNRDQDGETRFRFRFALRGHDGYDGAAAARFAREVSAELLALPGRAAAEPLGLEVAPDRAVALCLKPAEPPAEGLVLRLWETAGRSGPLAVKLPGLRRAVRLDLLERELAELAVADDAVALDLPAHGLAAVRLER